MNRISPYQKDFDLNGHPFFHSLALSGEIFTDILRWRKEESVEMTYKYKYV